MSPVLLQLDGEGLPAAGDDLAVQVNDRDLKGGLAGDALLPGQRLVERPLFYIPFPSVDGFIQEGHILLRRVIGLTLVPELDSLTHIDCSFVAGENRYVRGCEVCLADNV